MSSKQGRPKKMKTRNHERSEKSAAMSISLPAELRERIKAAAELDRRNASQFIVVQMERVLAELEAARLAQEAPQGSQGNGRKAV